MAEVNNIRLPPFFEPRPRSRNLLNPTENRPREIRTARSDSRSICKLKCINHFRKRTIYNHRKTTSPVLGITALFPS